MAVDLVQCGLCKSVFITECRQHHWWPGCELCNASFDNLRLIMEIPDGPADKDAA